MVAHSLVRRRSSLALACIVGALLALTLGGGQASAHPLGNFTINHYSALLLGGQTVGVHYVIDMAEIPTYQEVRQIDTSGDALVDQQEQDAYLPGKVGQLRGGLRLTANGAPLELAVVSQAMRLDVGQAGLRVLRIEADFAATLPAGATAIDLSYEDANYSDRLGWREVVVTGGPGAVVTRSDALGQSLSSELREYPQDSLSSPLDMSRAHVTFNADPTVSSGTMSRPGTSAQTAGAAAERVRRATSGGLATGRVAALISTGQLSATVIVVSILAAIFWGAAHALTPGHGKAVVAAYLVGARGTARHAAFLGLTVTLTHTAGVFALGAVTLYLSRYILPEELYPWLNVISGLLVIAIGCTLAYRRLSRATAPQPILAHAHAAAHAHDHGHRHPHDDAHGHGHAHDHHHSHDHEHEHGHGHSHLPPGADGTRITPRSLLALGVSGGLVPCPSALVLLLSAISLGRLEFGIVLVLAFSAGLAAVLTGIGLLCVYARHVFARFSFEPRIPRLLPVASALVVTLAGAAIVIEALRQAGIV